MIATLRRLLLVAAGAIALSASGLAQQAAPTVYSQGLAAYERADYAEAFRLIRLAVDQGSRDAQADLGSMYYNGKGTPQNFVEAIRWYRLAADRGNVICQYNLGIMYAQGQGAPQNFVEAYKWLSLVAARGDPDAAKNRDIVLAKMTPAQIAEGQRLSAAWKPK